MRPEAAMRPPTIAAADPRANYLAHKDEIDRAVASVLERGRFVLGPEVAAFEREFAAFLSSGDGRAAAPGARMAPRIAAAENGRAAEAGPLHAVGVASGTDALQLALQACGVGPGDVVATVSLTSSATVAAIDSAGATPLLIDVDAATFTMDPEALEDAVRRGPRDRGRLKAIVPVHLFGHPADMPSICALARRRGLRVVEDCAQSHGASIDGRMTGTWGDAAAFSFYPTKNLGALGDGGAVVSSNPSVADRARLLRVYGWRERQVSEIPGTNSRLDELQAAVLRVKLRFLSDENRRRAEIARRYDRALSTAPPRSNARPEVARGARPPRQGRSPLAQSPARPTRRGPGSTADPQPPVIRPGVVHAYHQYAVRSSRRDELKEFLEQNDVEARILFPVPVHRQPAYRDRVAVGPGGLRRTEAICRESLCLPMHPHLPPASAERVAELISRWIS